MQVEIVDGFENLDALKGAVVIFDVYRASNTIISLLAKGAEKIILQSRLEDAKSIKSENPDYLLFGERDGLTPLGFEGGNSPTLAQQMDLTGKTIILTTSAGTRAVHLLTNASRVVFGSFANAKAVSQRLSQEKHETVYMLPMGLKGEEPALEDDKAAWYIAELLKGNQPDFEALKNELLTCKGARRLIRLNQTDDLKFCTQLDSFKVVPRVSYEKYPVAGIWK